MIPENAAREQIKFIIPVIKDALGKSKTGIKDIDAIAVTYGPGLIGSLLIGVETAKALSYVWNKPLIPTNHLLGHIYANFIQMTDNRGLRTDSGKTEITASVESVQSAIRHPSSAFRPPAFPLIALIVSGGHTDLILIKNHGSIEWLGGTRDDAAGESLDKIGRLLGLPYPGGPHIEQASQRGDASRFTFPSPLIDSHDFDFSFSGLKTAVFRETQTMQPLSYSTICDLSASVQKAIIDVLVKKTLTAAKQFGAKSLLLGGGVAANNKLREQFELEARSQKLGAKIFVPPKNLCTDNAAMIAATAFFNYQTVSWQKLDANPSLYFN
ncbi:MAG: tRNA (adenosine(37)-N6)-threonylcarbamoyltransferase complex transferase subunit TsaD [Candidatus Levybacteria bacterium]|nr:tRNA (adenosine(37)-N6)-threonylcarbamoyltransferase complex transferase subunit TsaD [Candidatus Levybacteria bacterium]